MCRKPWILTSRRMRGRRRESLLSITPNLLVNQQGARRSGEYITLCVGLNFWKLKFLSSQTFLNWLWKWKKKKTLQKDQKRKSNLKSSFLHVNNASCSIASHVKTDKLAHVRWISKMWFPFRVIGAAETACQLEKVKVTFVLHHRV